MATLREKITQYLSDHDVQDREGKATAKLVKALRLHDGQVGSVSTILRQMENDGVIERVVSGKRTYAIHLKAAATNGQRPAPEAPQSDDGEDYVKLGLGVLQAASKALTENETLRKELEHVRSQLQAAELANAAMERQVAETKATADRVAATLPTEVKKDVRALLTKVKRLG